MKDIEDIVNLNNNEIYRKVNGIDHIMLREEGDLDEQYPGIKNMVLEICDYVEAEEFVNKKMFKNKGLNYKEIILDRSESHDFHKIENKLKKNLKLP